MRELCAVERGDSPPSQEHVVCTPSPTVRCLLRALCAEPVGFMRRRTASPYRTPTPAVCADWECGVCDVVSAVRAT